VQRRDKWRIANIHPPRLPSIVPLAASIGCNSKPAKRLIDFPTVSVRLRDPMWLGRRGRDEALQGSIRLTVFPASVMDLREATVT
jgi:hypothetical protein